jgi:hypothetical protein
MIRKLLASAFAAAFAVPALAETGVGLSSIDNVASVYGRAAIPAVKVSGTVVSSGADVNMSGRALAPAAAVKAVESAGRGFRPLVSARCRAVQPGVCSSLRAPGSNRCEASTNSVRFALSLPV